MSISAASTISPPQTVHLFERTEHGAKRAPVTLAALDDPALDALRRRRAGRHGCAKKSSCSTWPDASSISTAVLAGELTPVCFGSALTNFGVELFLERFVEIGSAARPREPTSTARSIRIGRSSRDSSSRSRRTWIRAIATGSRSCGSAPDGSRATWRSGIPGSKRKVRLAPPLRLFGQDREVVEEAFAGDVIGVINPGHVRDRRHGQRARYRHLSAPASLPAGALRATPLDAEPTATSSSSRGFRRSRKRGRSSSSIRSPAAAASRSWQRSARCSSTSSASDSKPSTTSRRSSSR